MKAKTLIVLTLLAVLLMSTMACGGGGKEATVGAAEEVVQDFIKSAETFDPEKMVSYWVPEMRSDLISFVEGSFEGIRSISHNDIHTEVTSDSEDTIEVFATWGGRAELDNGDVIQIDGEAYYSLERRGSEWLISNVR